MEKYFILLQLLNFVSTEILFAFFFSTEKFKTYHSVPSCISHISTAGESRAIFLTLVMKVHKDETTRLS